MEEIVCSKCGQESGINQLYCQHCGAKLDYTGFKPGQTTSGKVLTGRSGGTVGHGKVSGFNIMSIVRSIIFLCLLAALGLLVWPVAPTGLRGNEDNASDYLRKIVRMDHAIKENTPTTVTLNEAEVNGFLASVLKETHDAQGGSGFMDFTEINVRFSQKYAYILFVAQAGPLKITREIMLEPQKGQKLSEAEIIQVRFGHMKLPPGAREWLAKRDLSTVFAHREREIFVIKNSALGDITTRKVMIQPQP